MGYPKTGPAKHQPRLVGTVDVFLKEKEGALPRRLFLKNMIIDEAFRRQGFAKRLLARAEEHAREVGVRKVCLEVLGTPSFLLPSPPFLLWLDVCMCVYIRLSMSTVSIHRPTHPPTYQGTMKGPCCCTKVRDTIIPPTHSIY